MLPLTSDIIHDILSTCPVTKKLFKGVYARGLLPTWDVSEGPSIIVVNSSSFRGRGTHWLLVCFTSQYTIFADPLGLTPDIYNYNILVERGGVPIILNIDTVQSIVSNSCGYHCIFFAYCFASGLTLTEILTHYSKIDLAANDLLAYHFVKRLAWRVLQVEI